MLIDDSGKAVIVWRDGARHRIDWNTKERKKKEQQKLNRPKRKGGERDDHHLYTVHRVDAIWMKKGQREERIFG